MIRNELELRRVNFDPKHHSHIALVFGMGYALRTSLTGIHGPAFRS
jgi:hypothetical protein